MKSYLSHLRSTSFLNEEVNVFRSSAIFPIFLNRSINCKINFLSYWMVKKKIAEITCIYSIRDNLGKLLIRNRLSQIIWRDNIIFFTHIYSAQTLYQIWCLKR